MATVTAFSNQHLIATGALRDVLRETKKLVDMGEAPRVAVFDDATGRQLEVSFRGTMEEVLEREAPTEKHDGPGRPRLGVVSREVSLLPRHWEWLERQPSGASAALRKLVEAAATSSGAAIAQAKEATYRFMTAMAGNLAGYEEALRALYRGDRRKFDRETKSWPADVKAHAKRLAGGAFQKNAP